MLDFELFGMETTPGTGEVGSRSHSWTTLRGKVRRLTVRRLHECGAHKEFLLPVGERCRKVESVPVVFRSHLYTGFLVVSLEFHLLRERERVLRRLEGNFSGGQKKGRSLSRKELRPCARVQHLGSTHRARGTKAAGGRELW